MKDWTIEGELRENVVAALQKSPWFKALGREHLETVVGVAALASYGAGETIVRLGEPSDAIYLLMRGEVAVEVGRKGGDSTVEVGRMKPPFTFGEIGLLLGKPRTATVIATEEVYALKFDAPTFQRIFDEVPGFRLSLARGLASRLQDLSEMVLPEHPPTDAAPSEEVLAMLPPGFMQRHRVLPLQVDGNVITVGFMEDPTPQALAGVHQQLPGMEVKPVRITSQLFATLHTNSAVSTVERLVDMFPGDQQNQARSTLADVLRGVVAQTLCKGRTGGRVAAVEVLVGGAAATNLIREGKPAQLMNVMQTGAKEGNRLLNDDLARLVRDHKVLYEEALSKAVDKYDLARRLGKVKGAFERTEGDKR